MDLQILRKRINLLEPISESRLEELAVLLGNSINRKGIHTARAQVYELVKAGFLAEKNPKKNQKPPKFREYRPTLSGIRAYNAYICSG